MGVSSSFWGCWVGVAVAVGKRVGVGVGRFDPVIAKRDQERIEAEETLAQEMERWAERREEARAAIEQIESDNKREVLLMTWDGKSVAEIMDKLGLSRDNLYQLRRRALQRVEQILSGDDEP